MSADDLPKIPDSIKSISLSETKKVYAAGKYDWTAAWAVVIALAPTAIDYLAQFLAWLLSSPDAPQIPDEYKTLAHTAAFVLSLFARGILVRKKQVPLDAVE